jgi:branched-chain amino acid transport system substrate-binding protein
MKKVFVFVIACICITSCKEDDTTKKIGIVIPLTGEVATYGESVKKGIDIAYENLRDTKFKYAKPIYGDSKGQKGAAINVLENLFFSKVKFFIGDATSTVTYEIGPRIQAKGGLLIVPIATGDKIREIGDNVFMISPRNEKQTQRIIEYIKERGESPNEIGCLFKQNDYGVNIANTFFKEFSNAYSQAYQEGQNDFKSILVKFREKNIKTIFVPGNYEETALILKQAKGLNYAPTFIGTDGSYSPKLIELAGEGTSNGFLLTMMPIDYSSDSYIKFKALYNKKYPNEEEDIFACYGYETFIVLINAMENTQNCTVKEVSDYLRNHDFNSLTGTLKFDLQGEAIREYQIYEVKDDKFVPFGNNK